MLAEVIDLFPKFFRRWRRYGWRGVLPRLVAFSRQRLGLSGVGSHWSFLAVQVEAEDRLKVWHDCPVVHRAWARRLELPPETPPHERLGRYLRSKVGERKFRRALSLGTGVGQMELALVQLGIVEKLIGFEIAEGAVEKARSSAQARGLAHRIEFRCAPISEAWTAPDEHYDLILWNHSLHHMKPVRHALDQCARLLQVSGVFLAEEYVGPSVFQWSDEQVRRINEWRRTLPEALFRRPDFPEELFPREIRRPHREDVLRADPTEALESELIVEELKSSFSLNGFKQIEVRGLSGAVFHPGLEGIAAHVGLEAELDRLGLRTVLEELTRLDEDSSTWPGVDHQFAVLYALR